MQKSDGIVNFQYTCNYLRRARVNKCQDRGRVFRKDTTIFKAYRPSLYTIPYSTPYSTNYTITCRAHLSLKARGRRLTSAHIPTSDPITPSTPSTDSPRLYRAMLVKEDPWVNVWAAHQGLAVEVAGTGYVAYACL